MTCIELRFKTEINSGRLVDERAGLNLYFLSNLSLYYLSNPPCYFLLIAMVLPGRREIARGGDAHHCAFQSGGCGLSAHIQPYVSTSEIVDRGFSPFGTVIFK